jgi:hypothetical protein
MEVYSMLATSIFSFSKVTPRGRARLLLISPFVFFVTSTAQQLTFTLDVAATSDQKEVKLTVPPSGEVPLAIIRLGKIQGPFELKLSQFRSDKGGYVGVALTLPSQPDRKPQSRQTNVVVKGSSLDLLLSVPHLPTPDEYRGNLFLMSAGQKPLIWALTLTRAKVQTPAEMVLDRQSVSLSFTQPIPLLERTGPHFTVTLREKKGEWPLEDITVSLERVAEAPGIGFDLSDMLFTLNGKAVDFANPDTSTLSVRTIPEGGQATIGISFSDLKPGTYNATLRFRATNSVETDAQKLTLTLKIRHPWAWASLLLLVAVLFSFVGTKGLTMLRQRSSLERRIGELTQAKLQAQGSILPAIWVSAMLRQADELSRSLWISAPDVIESRINDAGKLLNLLEQVDQLMVRLQGMGPSLVQRRMVAAVNRAFSPLGAGPPDENTRAAVEKQIKELNEWLEPGKKNERYGVDLKAAIDLILEQVSLGAFKHRSDETQKEVERLISRIKVKTLPEELEEKIETERQYARLKILWERRNWENIDQLAGISRDLTLEKLFEKVDNDVWERLEKAKEESKLHISCPNPNAPDPLEAYDPLDFTLKTEDPQIEGTYLFKRGLRFEWKFELGRKGWKLALRKILKLVSVEPRIVQSKELKPVSVEPRIVQYAPWPCTLKPSVRIFYESDGKTDSIEVKEKEALTIETSKVFHWWKEFEMAEMLGTVLSIGLAVITGLATYYFGSETFGSLKDYLTMFIWGAGVDQTKNALQVLQTYTTKGER